MSPSLHLPSTSTGLFALPFFSVHFLRSGNGTISHLGTSHSDTKALLTCRLPGWTEVISGGGAARPRPARPPPCACPSSSCVSHHALFRLLS